MNKPAAKSSKVGEVVFLFEKINAARELSSCCVGTEAILETGRNLENLRPRKRISDTPKNRK